MVLDREGGGSPPAGKEASEIMEAMRKPEKALRYEVEVSERGQVELTVPFSPGSRVVVLVFEEAEDPFGDLLDAAQTSLGFWDNPWMTRTGTVPEQGDIVLIPIPFTDISSTSNPAPASYSFTVTSSDLTLGRLRRLIMVRVDKIFTLAQGLTVKIFGRVNDGKLNRIRGLLQQMTA